MTALTLHFPEQRGIARWSLSAITIVVAHAIVIGALAIWYTRTPPQPTVIPAIAITFAPVDTTTLTPEDDKAIGTPQEQIDAPPPEPEKTEKPVEPIEKLMPPPPQPAEVTLPKPVEQAKQEERPIEQQRAQEARTAGPKNEALQVANVAASRAYDALVSGHLRRFIRTAAAARYGSGKLWIGFVLDRDGRVLSSKLEKPSGNTALDREALELINRANPFPPFPAAKLDMQEAFSAPIAFERQ
jgi:periplasmic protein TonB